MENVTDLVLGLLACLVAVCLLRPEKPPHRAYARVDRPGSDATRTSRVRSLSRSR